MEKNIIILIVVLFIITNCVNFGLFFNNRKNIENMANTDDNKIKELINSIYKVDVQAIRNLADISVKLQDSKGLTIPGDLTIEGNINLKKDLKMVNGASIRSAGRLHIAPEEILYLLPKKGTLLTKNWGASGSINIEGDINLKKDLKMENGASVIKGTVNTQNVKIGNTVITENILKRIINQQQYAGFAIDGGGTTMPLYEGQHNLYGEAQFDAWTNDKWDIIYINRGWRITVGAHGNMVGTFAVGQNKTSNVPTKLKLSANQASSYKAEWIGY